MKQVIYVIIIKNTELSTRVSYMKKVLSFVLAFIFASASAVFPAYAGSENTLNIDKNNISHDVPQDLYGLNLEDISYACDGGLVSNLVNNNSFEYKDNPQTAWQFNNIEAVLSTDDAMHENNPTYETLSVDGKGVVKNLGFTELYKSGTYSYNEKSAGTGDMGFEENVKYDFSFYVKNINFEGTICVYLDTKGNASSKTQLDTQNIGSKVWTKLSATLNAEKTEDGALAIEFDGTGSIEIDFVSLVAQNSYGYAQDEWKYTSLRNDLVQAIKNLSPAFIKFPGENAGAGTGTSDLFSWKDTIGVPEQRRQFCNVWENPENGNNCNNTNAMGYHEYFQLCEDLGAKAIPSVSAGIAQSRADSYKLYADALKKLSMSSEEWSAYLTNEKGYDSTLSENYTAEIEALNIKSQSDYDDYIHSVALTPGSDDFNNYVQDILDLIEYANGDASTTYWGALRAANGHESPFGMEYLSVSGRNADSTYLRNFDAIQKAVNEKHPEITLLASCSAQSDGAEFDNAHSTINSKYKNVIAEEYCFSTDNYLYEHNDRYDNYDRDGAPVFVAGYSAVSPKEKGAVTKKLSSAVEEAGFMTALERNSDIIRFSSYSPTLAKINANAAPTALVWFDSQDIILTPSYYAQLMFANNYGNKYINASVTGDGVNDKIYQSTTVDEEKSVIYIKLVNNGARDSINVSLNGFEDITKVSNLYISNAFDTVSNELEKQYVAPAQKEIEFSQGSFEIELESNSVNVVRIAYGENVGDNFYILPEDIDCTVKKYIPPSVKIICAAIVLSVLLGTVIGFFMYRNIISKNAKKKKRNNRKKRK